MPAADGPRLVYDAANPVKTAPAPPPERPMRRRALVALAGLVLVAAIAAALVQHQRATALEARVTELTTSLATAEAEIAARRAHLGAIRASVATVRDSVGALESLAGAEPLPAPPPPSAPVR